MSNVRFLADRRAVHLPAAGCGGAVARLVRGYYDRGGRATVPTLAERPLWRLALRRKGGKLVLFGAGVMLVAGQSEYLAR